MKKYVAYSLKGTAVQTEVTRRFSDFFSLRKKLRERWPGVYIPNIPPKKAVGNLESAVINSRTRLLNVFCQKLFQFTFLFESEEVKLFQSDQPEIAKVLEKMPPLSNEEILEKYREAFPDYYEAYDVILGKGKLSEFLLFLKRTLTNIKVSFHLFKNSIYIHTMKQNFKESVASTLKKKQEEIDGYLLLFKSFQDYESSTLIECAENQDPNKLVFINEDNAALAQKIEQLKTVLSNPYTGIFEWFEQEEIEFEAMIEALNSFFGLYESYNKLSEKVDSLANEIKAFQFGQNNFKSIFSLKKKEDSLTILEENKNKAEEEKGILLMISKLAAFNMECYQEYFKSDKMKEYYKQLKKFANLQKQNDHVLKDLWETVIKDKNVEARRADDALASFS